MEYIYEVPIYDGALKNWRILNLNTGTFYSMKYATQNEAVADIEHLTERAGTTVRRVFLPEVVRALDSAPPAGNPR